MIFMYGRRGLTTHLSCDVILLDIRVDVGGNKGLQPYGECLYVTTYRNLAFGPSINSTGFLFFFILTNILTNFYPYRLFFSQY